MEKLKSMFHVTHTHSVTQDDFAKFVNCQADFGVRGVLLVEVGAETPDQRQCPEPTRHTPMNGTQKCLTVAMRVAGAAVFA